MNHRKRPRSEDDSRDDGRQCKHLRTAEAADDPTLHGLHESSPLYKSIRKWIQNVQIPENPSIDMADINAERGDDPSEVIMIGQLEASFTIEEAAPSLEYPGSPMKRKFSLASQSGSSSASNRDLSIHRLAEPVSRLDITKQLRSRNSSPEKQSTRSKSRNSSPDKQSVSARTTVSQGTNSISLRRSAMAECSPAFVFCHNNRLASGNIPKAVLDFKKRISSAGLLKGCLPSSHQGELVARFPDDDFDPSFFCDSPKYESSLVDHVTSYHKDGIRNFCNDATESSWSEMAKALLGGLSNPRWGPLEVTRIENNNLQAGILPLKIPALRSDIVIQANLLYSSNFSQLCRQVASPPVEVDKSFSPFSHISLKLSPAFAVVEVKSDGGDFQEAQTQAAVVGSAILLKARQIGASVEAVPCVPAVIVLGHTWHLNLIYEETNAIIIAGRWIIGDTVTFLGTLKIVLFVEELRSYAQDKWWKLFVDGCCRELLESNLEL